VTASLRIRVSIAAALALLLSACATTPQADARFGQSVRAAVSAQIAQPDAARNPRPVLGIDGRAARAAQEHYERSFGKGDAAAAAPAGLVGTR
jgi:type IV pilus biogenesis protein CpaD/CtpE